MDLLKTYCMIFKTSARIFSKTLCLQLRQVMRLTGLRPSEETDKVGSDISQPLTHIWSWGGILTIEIN